MTTRTSNFIHQFEPSKTAAAPTLLLLHGTGGNEHDLLDIGRTITPTANLLSPRGRVLEHGMPRFFRRLAEGVFDEPDLIARTNELADFVSEAAGNYRFDIYRVWAVGFSNGANIAASLLLLHPKRLAGAVLWRPMVPLTPAESPDLTGRQILMANGQADPMVPAENRLRLAALFREAGAQVTESLVPSGHQLTERDIATARDWLAARI